MNTRNNLRAQIIPSGLVLIGFLAVACSDLTGPVSFAGTWVGSNSANDLQLVLIQQADTVQGTVHFVLHRSGVQCTAPLTNTVVRGDSLNFLAYIPLDCRLNSLAVLFHGARLRLTNRIYATVGIDTVTAMVLILQ